jgi:imidazolonepropionase-like amidohydrolase
MRTAVIAAFLAGASIAAAQESETVAVKCGKVLTCGKAGVLNHAVLLIRDGKIVEIGEKVAIPSGAKVIDASDAWVMPGMIDLHCHIGGSMWDINEMVNPRNPELSTRPTIDPDNEYLKVAVAAGVTTVLYIPGSGTNLSGFGVLMKTGGGRTIDDVTLRFPGALKIAQAGNPERHGGDLGLSRMGMWWGLRKTLERAKAYHEALEAFEKGLTKVKPETQSDLEMMRGLFQRKYPIIIHTVGARDVMATIRMLHDELKLPIILSHVEFGGYFIAPEIAKRDLHTNVGPRTVDFEAMWFRYVDRGRFFGIPQKYYDAGVKRISMNTDSPVVPQEDLWYQAAMAVRYGLPEEVALKSVTIHPAQAVLADQWVGSLEVGKHADLVIKSGDPFDIRSYVKMTIINGRVVYDAKRDGRRY